MVNKETNRFEGDVYFAASSEPSIYGSGSMTLEGDLIVDGSVTVIGGVNATHSSLSGLSLDDHTQYLLLAGRTGGQIVTGGIASGNNVTIRSTTNATKGSVIFDETTATTSSITGSVRISGGIGISNTTDATSSTNGGTITTAGGLAVAKKAFIGTDLSVGGNITNGSWNANTIAVVYGGTGATSFSTNAVLLGNGTSALQNAVGMTYSSSILTVPSIVSNNPTPSTSSITGSIQVAGGIGISNTTDATSSTNGGTITTAGGLAVAKKAFIGTDLSVGGDLTVTGVAALPHQNLTGLLNDDHTQYLLLAGRTGGQIVTGGIASGNNVTIRSTTNATKGSVIFDETTATTSSITGSVRISGGIGISNTTDATSSTNGGTITTAGGLAVAKKAFVGTDLSVGGNLTVTGVAALPHQNLTGLLNDDHTQYLLLAGRTGGQIVTGGIASGNNVTIRSTTNATKGSVIFDETTATTSSTTGSIQVAGGIGISNTTDATSSTNGGTITTAGGLAVAKKAFVGTDLSVGGNITNGSWNASTISVAYGGTGATSFSTNAVLLGNGTSALQNAVGMTYSSSILTVPSIISNNSTTSTSSITGSIQVAGGIGISNTTDATSSTNGGTITTAGGLAVAKKAFIGTDLSIGGNITNGTWNSNTITVAYGGTGATSFSTNAVLLGNGTSALQNAVGMTYSSSILTVPSIISNNSTPTTSSTTGSIQVAGGIGISNTTDATSSTNGGTITTAGGLAVAKKLFVGGLGSFENQINMNNTRIINLGEPLNNSDAVTKQYVDIAIQGLDAKQSVSVATTVSGTMSTSYQNGSTVDGVILSTGDRILIKNQGNVNDGVYVVNSSGIPTRASDFSIGLAVAGSFLFVEKGVENGGNGWVCASVIGSDIVGIDTLIFSQFSGAGSITAGTGLTKTGNTLSVNSFQTQINQLGTINTGTWNASTISVAYGGTGATSFSTNAVLLGNGTSALQNAVGMTYSSSILTVPSIISNNSTPSTSSITGSIQVAGGIGISNTTDATSSTNGGTITTAGGLAVAKKAFIGTDLSVGGNLTVTGVAALPHQNLTGLLNDDHTQYLLLAGRTGGQIVTGGIASGNNVTIRSTTNATKGSVIFDETTATTSSITGSVRISGGIGISNTADATSSTNGGTITTAGGLAVAKKAFVGTDLSVGGNLTVTGVAALPHQNLTGLLNDDHTQYLLLAGRTGGQIVIGGVASGNNVTIRSTTDATKGSVIFDETTATTSSITGSVRISGGIGISNTTDATSSTNGGTITTAGGLAVAKKAFVGGDLVVGGSLSVVGGFISPHSNLSGLLNDDHAQYLLLAGRIGGQIVTGGTASGNNVTIRSTTNATKGSVIFDETTVTTSSITGSVRISGGIGISNTTDAVSITNGGTFTTAGGISVAKKVFIGDTLNTGSITITNSVKNTLTINCQNSTANPGEIIFSNTSGTGDFAIRGDGGDVVWQGGGGRPMQFGAYHEVRIFGGRTVTTPLPQLSGSNSTFNTVIQNSNNSIGLRIQGVSGQTSNLTQWTSNTGLVYSSVDNLGNISVPNCNVTGYIQMNSSTSPSNPGGAQFRYYTDTSDGLFKSKNSSGNVTIYQPCNLKGDLATHDGTTNVKLQVGLDGSYLQSDSSSPSGLSWNPRSTGHIRDQKTSGTNGGTATTGNFNIRNLNTATYYPTSQTDISLSGNQITLQPGIYKIYATVPAYRVNSFTARLFDSTNNIVLLFGSSAFADNSTTAGVTSSIINGIITVVSSINIRLEMRCQSSRSNDGYGSPSGYQTELYSQIMIEKL